MQYNQVLNENGGLFRYIIILVFTAIAGLFLYAIFFVLTAIAVYFTKKNNLKEFVPQHGKSNVVYLNSASEQWHKNRGLKRKRFPSSIKNKVVSNTDKVTQKRTLS